MTQIINNPFILVDGSSYLYRAYYALPKLTNNTGELTNVIYGVLNMLRSLMTQYKPNHIAVVFDAKGKTFRDDLFKNYKAKRLPMHKDLCKQISPLYEIISAIGIPILVIDGVEADDVIGTLALRASKRGIQVLISTGDKDMAQLVNSKIRLINTMNKAILGVDEIIDKYGVPPKLIIDFIALMGDSSDNIPGIPGIGKKIALTLLQCIGDLETIYQDLSVISSLKFRGSKTLAKKMEQYKDMAFLSYKLATIKTNVDLTTDYDELILQDPNIKRLYELFNYYEFKHWIVNLNNGDDWFTKKTTKSSINPVHYDKDTFLYKHSFSTSKKDYQIILTKSNLIQWIEKLQSAQYFAFDIKTNSFDILSANLIGLSFTIAKGECAYLPLGHNYLNAPEQLPLNEVLKAIKPILVNKKNYKICQNLKFIYEIMINYDIQLNNIAFDTILESYILNNVIKYKKHNINDLVEHYLNYKPINLESILGKEKKQLIFNQMPIQQASVYAAKDTDLILFLHEQLWPKLEAEPKLKFIFQHIEMPLVPLLARMELVGVLIDAKKLYKQSKDIARKLIALEREAYAIVEQKFNLSSPKQLQVILFTKLKLPVIKKTPNGEPSTNEEVLEELAFNHVLPKIILKHRSLLKLKSAYIDKLPMMINPKTKRVHTSYYQTVTVTGRLSSREPNLQNIPVRTEEGRKIRQAFIARNGYKIISADYSQIELRIMAHLSQDQELLNAFSTGQDIHRVTAAEVFGVLLTDVTSEQRRSAKAINFGLIYGMSTFGLARKLGISHIKAQYYIKRYFDQYPGILDYMEYIRNHAAEKGYVETLFGRRLYIPNINSSNLIKRKASEREAMNAPMQGTAADIIKIAMIALDKWIESVKPDVYMLIQVHDELVFEVKESAINQSQQKIRRLMEESTKLTIPLKVDIGIGDNWDEAH